ncbi:MAG: PAS domain-containing protein [Alphaproteobacteria bacterium]|nr:PAS domain-containing protein [Alphaproteobacteria bacterium]
MSKSSTTALILASISLVALFVWQVSTGYNDAKTAFLENLELVLRENTATNRVLLQGHVRRVGDLAALVNEPGFPTLLSRECLEVGDAGCLPGLTVWPSKSGDWRASPIVDCGQDEFLARLEDVQDRTYAIGPTAWMPSDRVMAPIAHAIPGGAGWIAACADIDPIRALWRDLELPTKTSMALIRATDFRLWVREPFSPDLLGRDLSNGPLVAAMLENGPGVGGTADITATQTDFVQRTVQWSPVGVDDLILVAGYSKDHFFETWFKREAPHLTIVAALVVAFMLMAFLSSRSIAKRFQEVSDLAQRLSIATEGAQIGVFDFDFRTGRLEWNDEMLRIYGMDRNQFTGTFEDWRQAVHPDDLAEAERLFSDARKAKGQFKTDFRIIRPDGVEAWIFAVAEFTETESGLPERVLGVNIDISERIHFQEELQQLSARLATERDKSEKDNKAKTDFMAHMSHEIRTPLNAIIGFTQILQTRLSGDDTSAKEKEYTEDILKAGNHLLGLANEFLDISKIEHNVLELDVKKHNAQDLIEDALTTANALKTNGVSFEVDVDAGLEVQCDKRTMHQCLLNLLTNAIKYSPRNGVIKVGASARKDQVAFFVEDSGAGIDSQLLQNIGRPFLRPQGPDVANPNGIGLGLAITKRLIEKQGGKLVVEAKQGVGTRAELAV